MEPGARVGHYEILDRLGSGGMGEVYRARDTRLDRVVALKVLKDATDPELLSRLDREARAASRLNHPHIVHIYDVGKPADGPPFVVMEHVEGETLRRRLNRERPGLVQVAEWGAQIAEGLASAHAAGIVHRDLKPENLMVTPEGRMKILDFGLAKLTGPVLGDIDTRTTLSRHATQAGTLLGTLEYMAPEQATGKAVDGRADQFALGAVLYEMASGRSPFRRDSAAEVLAAVLERHPEPLRGVSEELEAVVARCLAKEPGGRFADTGEIAHALRRRSAVPSIVSAQIVAERPAPLPERPSTWSVQSRDKVKVYEERKLAESIRRGRLSGLELVRREGEEQWQPLYESRVYQREVPAGSDPRRAAQWRSLRSVAGHLTGFVTTGIVMYATSGHVPFWMAFWGMGLASHLLRAAPTAVALLRAERALPAAVPAPPALPASPLEQEAARIRALLEKREDRERLLADVDAIMKMTAELAARIADLEEQTTHSERNAVAASETEARARVGRAHTDEDRQVFERQLQVVERRRQGMEQAVRLLDRLRARRETAEHELKQLRLDLSRGAAVEMPMPELSSRLQFIRHEVTAAEEIGRP